MSETVLGIAQTLSTGNNPVAVIAFVLLLMLAGVLIVVLRMFSSFIDFKKEMYRAGNLPDRGKRGERY